MVSNSVRSKVNLRDLDKALITTYNTMDPVPTILISSTPVPRHSERVVL